MPPADPEQARWIAEHVQPHEAMLRAWLRARFRDGCEGADVAHEAFVRVHRACGAKG